MSRSKNALTRLIKFSLVNILDVWDFKIIFLNTTQSSAQTRLPHRLSKLRKFEIIPQDFSNPFFAELRLKGDMVFIKSNFIDDDPIYLLDA